MNNVMYGEISQVQAKLNNLFVQLPELQFSNIFHDKDEIVLAFSPLQLSNRINSEACEWLQLDVEGEFCFLAGNFAHWLTELPGPFSRGINDSVPSHILMAALRQSLEPAVSKLATTLALPIRWMQSKNSPVSGENEHLYLDFNIHYQQKPLGCCRLYIPHHGSVVKALAKWCNRVIKNNQKDARVNRSISWQLGCGEQVIASEEFLSLQMGDIVLLPSNKCDWTLMISHCALANLQTHPQGWVVTGILANYIRQIDKEFDMSTEPTVNDVSTNDGEQIDWHQLSKVEVPLRFELGEQVVTLETLRSLKIGTVITTDIDLESPVDVYQGSQKVGKGRLIQVADRIGVQISEITRFMSQDERSTVIEVDESEELKRSEEAL